MKVAELHNQRILVIGLGLTGESVVRFLHRQQLAFDVVDEKASPTASLLPLLGNATVFDALTAELCCRYDVLVISPGVPRALPAIKAAEQAGKRIVGDIELFAGVVTQPVVAITGSNGKSTVASWLAHVLSHAGQGAVLCGNIGRPALDSIDDDADVYVLELSSYQLESTTSLQPAVAAVLNISDDHMDRYDDLAHYAAVKRTIYNKAASLVVNADDAATWPQAGESASAAQRDCFTVQQAAADAGNCRFHLQAAANDGSAAVAGDAVEGHAKDWLCRGDEQVTRRSDLPVPGDHNVANALAVMALASAFTLTRENLQRGLAGFRGLQHRTELVRERHGVRWYNDSKGTNIDASRNAIAAMPGPVVLIAGGLGKDADFSALVDVVAKHVKALVLIGQDRDLLASALGDVAPVTLADSMHEAVEKSAELASAGDVVLLSPACSSFDMFSNFAERGNVFTRAVEALAA